MKRRNFLKIGSAFAVLGASAKHVFSSSLPVGDKPPELAASAKVNASLVHRTSEVSSDYSIRPDDDLILVNGPCGLKLPSAEAGKVIYVRAQRGPVSVRAGGGYWKVKADHASAFISNGHTWFQM